MDINFKIDETITVVPTDQPVLGTFSNKQDGVVNASVSVTNNYSVKTWVKFGGPDVVATKGGVGVAPVPPNCVLLFYKGKATNISAILDTGSGPGSIDFTSGQGC